MREFPHLPPDITAALDSYEERLESGELHYDEKGDIVPDEYESQGWLEFVRDKLPPDDFSHGVLPAGQRLLSLSPGNIPSIQRKRSFR